MGVFCCSCCKKEKESPSGPALLSGGVCGTCARMYVRSLPIVVTGRTLTATPLVCLSAILSLVVIFVWRSPGPLLQGNFIFVEFLVSNPGLRM